MAPNNMDPATQANKGMQGYEQPGNEQNIMYCPL